MSGIYIPGMEMPKDGEHPYWVTIHSDGIIEYNENKGQGWQTSEAIPVPDHGDLIDRHNLKHKKITIDYDEWDDTFDDGLLFTTGLIDNAPTIIPADKGA